MAGEGREESYLLSVAEVRRETEDASSVVFSVPDELADVFAWTPGQFLTVGVPSQRTGLVARCYSICTPPGEPLTVTVKRTDGGYASQWINDQLQAGHSVRLLPPAGIFTPKRLDEDLLLIAAGSGITPVMSIVRTALRDGSGRVTLFYANRDERSVIFADPLRDLAARHPDRLQVIHWLESVQGLPLAAQLREFARPLMVGSAAGEACVAFTCGPAPFMTQVQAALKELGVPRARRHQEKFVSLGGNPFADVPEVRAVAEAAADPLGEVGAAAPEQAEPQPGSPDGGAKPVALAGDLDGVEFAFDDWQPGHKLLEFLESKGIQAPYSCRAGECSACAVRLVQGEVRMLHNDVLDQGDIDDGIRLACQSVPLSGNSVIVSWS